MCNVAPLTGSITRAIFFAFDHVSMRLPQQERNEPVTLSGGGIRGIAHEQAVT
jgi:hypothetical protein